MKTTEEYLYELVNDLAKINLNTGNPFIDTKNLMELINKYATLIDAIKIINHDKTN